MKTICLNMIVKNESKIIKRLFDSVIDIIDYWVICDTGSVDDTCEVIENYFREKGIRGELYRTEWKNFGNNRTEALRMANKKADYILLLDADMILKNENFDKNSLESDYYGIEQRTNSINYFNTRLIRGDIECECKGYTHEYYDLKGYKGDVLKTLYIKDIGDGGSKADKFYRDEQLLKLAIEAFPEDSRNYFYLAQTYKDMKNYDEAIKYYEIRYSMNNWDEEKWYSRYMIGYCYYMKNEFELAIFNLLKAYEERAWRSEPLYWVCKIFRELGLYKNSYHYFLLGNVIDYPEKDVLFIEKTVYKYLFWFEFSIIAYYLDLKEDGKKVSESLLDSDLPEYYKNQVKNNYKFYS